MKNKDVIFDIESYPNIFSVVFYVVATNKTFTFEVSQRSNDFAMFCAFVRLMGKRGCRMVGFNNYGYDYPVIHAVIGLQKLNRQPSWQKVVSVARDKNDEIIGGSHDNRFAHTIWDDQQVVQQVDLYKIHHFDNVSRSTSLKALEFNMRSNNIKDLPFDPTAPVPDHGFQEFMDYNRHDVMETFKFYEITMPNIRLREELRTKYGVNFLNANDTKIGKTIFQKSLEKKMGPDICFKKGADGKRKPRQTHRKEIVVKDILFPYVQFKRPEFQAVKEWMERQVFCGYETKGVFTGILPEELGSLEEYSDLATSRKKEWGHFEKDDDGNFILNKQGKKTPRALIKNLNCTADNFKFVFGTGGLHGCVDPCIVEADDTHMILDIDVTSYYPMEAIRNKVFPKHLGETFCDIYLNLFEQRQKHKKGTPENAALKLALNGVYGDSNNLFSPFYDPQYTMTITLNGQLLLCMLSEWLMELDGLEMIQANTDGVTVRIPRTLEDQVKQVCEAWEDETKLNLEYANYSRMFVRDVNNYIGEYEDGKLKNKGAYCHTTPLEDPDGYDLGWHQDHSALVVQKAVEAHLVRGEDVGEFIKAHLADHPFDFYLRAKVPRTSRLFLRSVGYEATGEQERIQNTSRCFISNSNKYLMKIMPPLPKNPDKYRSISVYKGWNVTVHNEAATIEDVNFDYYEKEAMKLINPLTK